MHQGIYKVVSNTSIADKTWRLTLSGDTTSIARGGQFVDIALDGHFLRRPLAVLEWDESGLSVIYKVVGKGTEELSAVRPGAGLDLLVGLGNGFDASKCRESALVVAGSIGASPTFSLVKELIALGRKVKVVLGFNSEKNVILADEYRALGAETTVVTLDGTLGTKGLVTDAMPDGGYDFFYTCGPKPMMKAVCEKALTSGEASLEERMGCGCGICYGCTCHTTGGARRVCADGPVFEKETIIW